MSELHEKDYMNMLKVHQQGIENDIEEMKITFAQHLDNCTNKLQKQFTEQIALLGQQKNSEKKSMSI